MALSRFAAKGNTAWLRQGSTYQDGHFPIDSTFNQVSDDELVDGIAIRGPLHCIDGWTYLARSLAALAAGSPHAARHLAYYAELRAALSILATQGIGSFNTRNVAIDASGNVIRLPNRPTHELVWLAIEYWARSPTSFDAIAGSIDIAGVSLLDAVQTFFPSPARRLLGSSLIRTLGFDLNNMYIDRDERNNSSYQVNSFDDLDTTTHEDVGFLAAFWISFEPSSFYLERYMLRALLEAQSMESSGETSLIGRSAEYDRLDSRLQSAVSLAFLERTEDAIDPPLLKYASVVDLPAPVLSMISRGSLLLRVAAALVDQNFRAVGVDPIIDLDFWWPEYGARKGFWPTDTPLDSPSELWTDIVDAMEDANSVGLGCRYDWLSSLPLGLPRLCEAERVGLWTLFR